MRLKSAAAPPEKAAAYETNALEGLRSGPSELEGEAFDWGDRSPSTGHPQYWTV